MSDAWESLSRRNRTDLPASRPAAAIDAHPALLVVDEAHGSGVYGPAGAGWCAHAGFADRVDITIVTLSKALGCIGAAVCGSRAFCDALINLGRGYIFSTSMPAAVAAAAEAAIGVLRDEPHRALRVRQLARLVRAEARSAGLVLPEAEPNDAPILPILLGTEAAALDAAQQLRARGVLALAIRPPTVPRNGSRLRITLSCEHSDGDLEALIRSLRELAEQSEPRQ
jgi:8-amino-7-oxononanoate synthase